MNDLATGWQRYWSRMLDVFLISAFVAEIFLLIFPDMFVSEYLDEPGEQSRIGIILSPFVYLVEAVLLAGFQNTLGRLLMGIRLETLDGRPLTITDTLSRGWRVYVFGGALGIPIVSMFTCMWNYHKIKNGRETSWDEAISTEVVNAGANGLRTTLVEILVITMMAIFIAAGQV